MSADPVIINIGDMIDIAIGTPEVGYVDFNMLHAVLHCLAQQCRILEKTVQLHGTGALNTPKDNVVTVAITEYAVETDKPIDKEGVKPTPLPAPRQTTDPNTLLVVERVRKIDSTPVTYYSGPQGGSESSGQLRGGKDVGKTGSKSGDESIGGQKGGHKGGQGGGQKGGQEYERSQDGQGGGQGKAHGSQEGSRGGYDSRETSHPGSQSLEVGLGKGKGGGQGGKGQGQTGGGIQYKTSSMERLSLVTWSKFNMLEGVVDDIKQRVYGSLPTNEDILEGVRSQTNLNAITDMWKSLNVSSRLEAAETGIGKLSSLVEDVIGDCNGMRNRMEQVTRSLGIAPASADHGLGMGIGMGASSVGGMSAGGIMSGGAGGGMGAGSVGGMSAGGIMSGGAGGVMGGGAGGGIGGGPGGGIGGGPGGGLGGGTGGGIGGGPGGGIAGGPGGGIGGGPGGGIPGGPGGGIGGGPGEGAGGGVGGGAGGGGGVGVGVGGGGGVGGVVQPGKGPAGTAATGMAHPGGYDVTSMAGNIREVSGNLGDYATIRDIHNLYNALGGVKADLESLTRTFYAALDDEFDDQGTGGTALGGKGSRHGSASDIEGGTYEGGTGSHESQGSAGGGVGAEGEDSRHGEDSAGSGQGAEGQESGGGGGGASRGGGGRSGVGGGGSGGGGGGSGGGSAQGGGKSNLKPTKKLISKDRIHGAGSPSAHLSERIVGLETKIKECVATMARSEGIMDDKVTSLQDQIVGILKQMQGSPRRSKTASLSQDVITDLKGLAQLFDTVHEMQAQFNQVHETALQLAAEKESRQYHMNAILEQIEMLKAIKMDREDMVEAMADKADVRMLARKVSYDQFELACDDLSKGLEHALGKLGMQEALWQQALDDIQREIETKLDKIELSPVKEFFNNKLRQLQDHLKQMAMLRREAEAAGTKRKLIRDVNCISCDAKAVMQAEPSTNVPIARPLPANLSMKPYLSYELDAIRKTQASGVPQRNMHDWEAIDKNDKKQARKVRSESDKHLCNRYCGGSHTVTTPAQRVTRLGHFIKQWGPDVLPMSSGLAAGDDGRLYKVAVPEKPDKPEKPESPTEPCTPKSPPRRESLPKPPPKLGPLNTNNECRCMDPSEPKSSK